MPTVTSVSRRWIRLSAIAIALGFLLGAATEFEALPLGAQAPLGGPVFYQAELTGDQVVPPVISSGSGAFEADGQEGGSEIRFHLSVRAPGITQAAIHLGGPDENGPAAAFLSSPADPPLDAVVIDGVLTETNLVGSVAGDWDAFVAALFDGAYVPVRTTGNPAGELPGRIFVALTATPVDPDGGSEDGGSRACSRPRSRRSLTPSSRPALAR